MVAAGMAISLHDATNKQIFVQGWDLIQLEQLLYSPGIMEQRNREAQVRAHMRDMEHDVLESLAPDHC